ncbi:MAG: hypothetical protein Q4C89_14820, partial [Deinococcus sp.]|uniref:hypothetical protein n=1 Tax=Deinococcus sp. TaxID=47478 RepID=UPI0026DBEEF3
TRGGTAGTSADGTPGDTLEYCLNYTNQSAIMLSSMTLRDSLTAGQTLLTGVYSGETLSLTRGDGAAQPTANSGSATTVSTTLTNVAAGETGQLCFQTQMDR